MSLEYLMTYHKRLVSLFPITALHQFVLPVIFGHIVTIWWKVPLLQHHHFQEAAYTIGHKDPIAEIRL